jgi:glycerophosphoryl diester phosphodiesterase
MKEATFDVQGHRGARGLKPENTLASFEAAFDAACTSIETDVHLSSDGVPVLVHDPRLNDKMYRVRDGHAGAVPDPAGQPLISSLTLGQLRCYRSDGNPDYVRFPTQNSEPTPLARSYAEEHGWDAFGIPALADLLAFAGAYAGEPGRRAGKTPSQRQGARSLRFDVELKRVPSHPEYIGDGFSGEQPALLERHVIDVLQAAGAVGRTSVRSFDHRSLRAIRTLRPDLATAILLVGMAPVDPGALAAATGATAFCPQFLFLDVSLVRRSHAAGLKVLPWAVNDPADWQRLIDWSVDGITTDFPDRLAAFLNLQSAI